MPKNATSYQVQTSCISAFAGRDWLPLYPRALHNRHPDSPRSDLGRINELYPWIQQQNDGTSLHRAPLPIPFLSFGLGKKIGIWHFLYNAMATIKGEGVNYECTAYVIFINTIWQKSASRTSHSLLHKSRWYTVAIMENSHSIRRDQVIFDKTAQLIRHSSTT